MDNLQEAKQAMERATTGGDYNDKRDAIDYVLMHGVIAQAEALEDIAHNLRYYVEAAQRQADALEKLAGCVDPEVPFFWVRELREKGGSE